jgi:hypothetical protein
VRAKLLVALALCSLPALAAGPQFGVILGRATESRETDIARLFYRHPLRPSEAWWMPTHVQAGASLWRVPDIRGSTRRLDLNATSIWRAERAWGYLEAGFGGYLLSKTINNDENRLPSSWQFGSHVGIGLKLGPGTVGLGLQHLSNAGIKQPNGGIDLVLLQYTVSTGTPNR